MLRVLLISIIAYIFSQSLAVGKFSISLRKNIYLIYNFLTVFCLYTFLNIFFWNYRINSYVVMILIYILSLTMYYVHEFRGTNINFSDILSINTAKEVAGGYKYTVKPIFIMVFLLIAFNILYDVKYESVDILANYNSMINTISGTNINRYTFFWHELGQILLFAISFSILRDKISNSKYDYSLFAGENEGYLYNFVSSIPIFHKRKIDKNEKNVIETFVKYVNNKESLNKRNIKNTQILGLIKKDLPHIIVIMNESFGTVNRRISTNIPVTPYYDKLTGVKKGNLYVNTFGGGTANTEFEFLTCMTIGNYKYPVMPYNNFVNTDKYSLARYFNKLGYNTIAMHPYTATNYHRNTVYKNFGFNELYFYDDFENRDCIRNYVSDEAMYKEVIKRYNIECDNNRKMFLFGITMQNHSGYSYFEGTNVKVKGIENVDLTAINSYLSLLRMSDDAIKLLIDYFEKTKEHVVILFFGDHNASFGTKLNKLFYDKSIDYECTNAYVTPYFIYDNKYNIVEKSKDVSANFLSLELLNATNLPLDAIHLVLDNIYRKYSIYNYHKRKNRFNGELTYIEDDIYMNLEKGYLK